MSLNSRKFQWHELEGRKESCTGDEMAGYELVSYEMDWAHLDCLRALPIDQTSVNSGRKHQLFCHFLAVKFSQRKSPRPIYQHMALDSNPED